MLQWRRPDGQPSVQLSPTCDADPNPNPNPNPKRGQVYNRIKSLMRCKVMHSDFAAPPLQYNMDQYNVAWHIRMGDGPGTRLQVQYDEVRV